VTVIMRCFFNPKFSSFGNHQGEADLISPKLFLGA
jgi:hypothetical protein